VPSSSPRRSFFLPLRHPLDFSERHDEHCHVDFALDCTTRSLFLMPVIELLVLPMATSMVAAFEARAYALAATPALRQGRRVPSQGRGVIREILVDRRLNARALSSVGSGRISRSPAGIAG
jgi:hypothetical protein